jgi:hypothetical protein
MRIVGTSTMQMVVAPANWKVGGRVVVAPGTVVVTAGVVVVVSGAVVVVAPVVVVSGTVVVVVATAVVVVTPVVVVAAFVFGTQSAHVVVVGATVVVVTADVLVVVGGGVHGPACNVCVGSVAEPTTMVCTTLPGNVNVKLTPNVTCGPPLTE